MRRTKGPKTVASAEGIASALGGREVSAGQFLARCPAHDDKTPSLSVKQNGDKILLHCFAGCEFTEIKEALEDRGISLDSGKEITKSLGLPEGILPKVDEYRYVAHWAYRNKDGEIQGYVVRYEDDSGEKSFRPYFQKDGGKWKQGYSADIKDSRPLYNLDKIARTEPGEQEIWITEGEKKADVLTGFGLTATTSLNGSQSPKKTDWTPLAGHHVVIWPDQDRAGKTYAANVFKTLQHLDESAIIEIVDVDQMDLDEKEDADDWAKKGYGEQDLLEIPRTPAADLSDIGVIEYHPAEPWKAMDAAEKLLLQVAPYEVFQRASYIYRITTTYHKSMRDREQENIGITQVTKEYLKDLFNRKLNFVQMKKDGYEPIDTPPKVVERYMERSGQWNLHVLSGLIYAPTLKPDGTVLERPGYDEASGVYINTSGTKFKPLKKDPGREDAEKALTLLRNPFRDFPFIKEEDESVALAAVLTALVRQSIGTAPLFGFTAPVAGSGKTLIANVISIIATGKQAVAASQGNDREEERKNLFAKLLQAKPVLLLDNIERPLSSDTLCAILTAPGQIYEDRILGRSKVEEVPTNVTFMATGNNLGFQGDMTRRALLCTLDPGVEKPETRRGFKYKDLEAHVFKRRAEYVNAGLTILKAYIREGSPKQNVQQYGSFEQWSDWIRSALVWLGCADPNKTRDKIEEEDPAKSNMAQILSLWKKVYDDDPVTTKEVVTDCNEALDKKQTETDEYELAQAFFEATSSKGKELSSKAIGYWIRKNKDKYLNGMKITKDPNSPGNKARWILRG